MADVKLNKTQISKLISSGRPFGSWLVNSGKKNNLELSNLNKSLFARDKLHGLVSTIDSVSERVKQKSKNKKAGFLVLN